MVLITGRRRTILTTTSIIAMDDFYQLHDMSGRKEVQSGKLRLSRNIHDGCHLTNVQGTRITRHNAMMIAILIQDDIQLTEYVLFN